MAGHARAARVFERDAGLLADALALAAWSPLLATTLEQNPDFLSWLARELNYSSDIDLLFLYSDEGETTGAGERGAVTNREFFCKLAERVSRIAGGRAGEPAAYRVDLRLRPHGRDGALAVSLAEALHYYRESARPWELQALIRARASAGSHMLFARFADALLTRVYRPDETVAVALARVRLAKQKIDRFRRDESRGFNVKLGRGGVRERELVPPALP